MADVLSTLVNAIRAVMTEMGAGDVEVAVEPSARPEFGDWSSPAALRAARVLRRPPLAIADQLRTKLDGMALELVAEWTVSPPGYVNARLRDEVWARDVLTSALAIDEQQPLDLPEQPSPSGKVLVEHTATNPNKAAHVGHLRNACIGDTVARILRRTSNHVEVNNYIDDTGVQVADVVVGIRELGIEPSDGEPFDQYCSRVYVEMSRRYEDDPSLLTRRGEVLRAVEHGDPEIAPYVKDLASRIVDCHLATMSRFNIQYDLLTWESDIIALGFWEKAFELLRSSGAIVFAETGKHAGCWVMPAGSGDQADLDSDETKVLVKSDGIVLYTAKDIAYQLWKFGLLGLDFYYRRWRPGHERPVTTFSRAGDDEVSGTYGKAQRVVNVIDARQAYPQQIVQRALRRLGFEREAASSIHLAYEVVALSPTAARELGVEPEGERELYAFSGRRGIEVRADDLLDRAIEKLSEKALDAETARLVGAGAIRYYLLKFSLTQIIAFDFDEALRVSGDTGVYLQYAHARSSGILRKTSDDGGTLAIPSGLEPSERALVQRIDGYRRALVEAAGAMAPSVLTAYTFSLASALSDFYEHTPPIVREEDPVMRRFRRTLVAAARLTLGDALSTLGIAALERI